MAIEGTPQPSTLSLTDVRDNLREVVGVVRAGGEVIITRRGKPVAVLIAFDEYESLIETVNILSDDDTMAAIAEGEADFAAGRASRYIEQHGEWFHDQEGRLSDKKEMREVISDWEGQHGPLTPQEKAEARAALGL